MVERSKDYSHIPLTLTIQGTAKPSRPPRSNPRSLANLGNRQAHGTKLKANVDAIFFSWQEEEEKRDEEGKPKLPNARRVILQIDPDAFDPDKLKSYGIEVIAELEDGYIIGASADLELSALQKKIEQFIKEERGGGTVAEIWELIEGYKKPELIVSPELWQHWDKVKDDQIYTVDVSIACLGLKAKLSDYPKRKTNETDEQFQAKVNRWINKRDLTDEDWNEEKSIREEELTDFVLNYQGEILSIVDGETTKYSELPDSFSCRIKISGKGLKDLVSNYPYIFEVSEPDEFLELIQRQGLADAESPSFQLDPPDNDAPKVCIIDSGIQERHSLLKAAIDGNNSRSWVPDEDNLTADYVKKGGHGTRVAGAVLYPNTIPRSGREQAICWLQNARILNSDNQLPKKLFPPIIIEDIVNIYHLTGTRLFNHSITGSVPCRTQYMSAWAAIIDQLTWKNDILLIVAAGNIPIDNRIGQTRLSIQEHLAANRSYPNYLLEDSCRIANPAQSFQALTVGSVSHNFYNQSSLTSIAQPHHPSAFSCSGFGIWESIKPEVVEYGGDLVTDGNIPPNLTHPKEVCPELVRSTLHGGSAIASDTIGTSFAAPKVTHIAARLAAQFPQESCLLYRALIVQSARWPEWAMADDVDKLGVIRSFGYGIPNLERASRNSPNRVTLYTKGERKIEARLAHIYQVKLPKKLISPGEDFQILLEVTLSYKAQPRRTRRNRRRYLSTWLNWECSKIGEDPQQFLKRVLDKYEAPEDTEKGQGIFKWMLGTQKNYGIVKGVSRGSGTIQKDWTIVNSYELTEAFCIAVVGHEGWNNDPDAYAPYSLVVSFEALRAEIEIYTEIAQVQVQVPIEVEQEVQI
ncbi:S8 family peptidase [Gloeothece verrucosa]|uniref:Peptidase S8/S53 domain-containing protein n=1 Tax=Gloeothece verrucosa (strain PCC 7822) TaxID=497965 RepID=E0UD56_GLOV7|nr:S8 family peptidase [Gloeothece verrucosa]ADN12936.1 conserved hypothetical protein [Gloeothece verrucosa PCC 7822]